MAFTIGGYTEEQLDEMRAAQGNPVAGRVAKLKVVGDQLREAVAVDAREAQQISAQQSLGARVSYGGQNAPDEIRRAKLETFRNSDAGKIPAAAREDSAAVVEQARAELANLLSNRVQAGDDAQRWENDRLIRLSRTRIGEDATIAHELAELDRHAGGRQELGLLADEARARHPQYTEVIDRHVTRLDPELAHAQKKLRSAEHDDQIVRTAAAAVEAAMKTGNAPSPAYFQSLQRAMNSD